MRMIVAFLTDCSGATSIEYAMVASMIAVAILAGVTNLGSAVKSNYTSVSTAPEVTAGAVAATGGKCQSDSVRASTSFVPRPRRGWPGQARP